MNRIAVNLSRAFLVLSIGWIAYTQTSHGQSSDLNIKKLKNELYVIEGTSNGSGDVGNVAVYVTSEGVILVDDRFAQDHGQIVAAVKRVTSQPIRYVINTHHHGDHTGSNLRFLATSELIAHSNARKHMLEGNMPGPPQIAFTDQTSVFLGGKEVRAIYYGRGHTDGDIAVYFPTEHVVHLGDLMAGTRGVTNPVVDYKNGGCLRDWPLTLDGVLKLDIDTVIPGHGEISTRDGLLAHRNKIASIRDQISGLVHEGKSKDEIGKLLVSKFDFKPINMGGLDGMMAELKN